MTLESLFSFILAAHGSWATIYGYGESFCGSPDKPAKCEKGAITASGELFDPDQATMALSVPNNIIIRPTIVVVRLNSTGECKPILLNDRKNEKHAHSVDRFDLTPATVMYLGGKPSPTWRGRLYLCFPTKHSGQFEYYKWNPFLVTN